MPTKCHPDVSGQAGEDLKLLCVCDPGWFLIRRLQLSGAGFRERSSIDLEFAERQWAEIQGDIRLPWRDLKCLLHDLRAAGDYGDTLNARRHRLKVDGGTADLRLVPLTGATKGGASEGTGSQSDADEVVLRVGIGRWKRMNAHLAVFL